MAIILFLSIDFFCCLQHANAPLGMRNANKVLPYTLKKFISMDSYFDEQLHWVELTLSAQNNVIFLPNGLKVKSDFELIYLTIYLKSSELFKYFFWPAVHSTGRKPGELLKELPNNCFSIKFLNWVLNFLLQYIVLVQTWHLSKVGKKSMDKISHNKLTSCDHLLFVFYLQWSLASATLLIFSVFICIFIFHQYILLMIEVMGPGQKSKANLWCCKLEVLHSTYCYASM